MHKSSFRHERYRHSTALSKKYGSFLHDEQKNYTISRRIAAKGCPTKGGNKDCDLCMTEQLLILSKCREPDNNILSSRKELISKCRHSNKIMLKKISLKI